MMKFLCEWKIIYTVLNTIRSEKLEHDTATELIFTATHRCKPTAITLRCRVISWKNSKIIWGLRRGLYDTYSIWNGKYPNNKLRRSNCRCPSSIRHAYKQQVHVHFHPFAMIRRPVLPRRIHQRTRLVWPTSRTIYANTQTFGTTSFISFSTLGSAAWSGAGEFLSIEWFPWPHIFIYRSWLSEQFNQDANIRDKRSREASVICKNWSEDETE